MLDIAVLLMFSLSVSPLPGCFGSSPPQSLGLPHSIEELLDRGSTFTWDLKLFCTEAKFVSFLVPYEACSGFSLNKEKEN